LTCQILDVIEKWRFRGIRIAGQTHVVLADSRSAQLQT
jgi:hypothetical protein